MWLVNGVHRDGPLYKEWLQGITWDDNFNPIFKAHQHVGCPNNLRVHIYSKPLVSKSARETDTWQAHNSGID